MVAKVAQKKEARISDKLVDELISQVDPSDILKKDGLFSKLKKQIVERVLQGELEHELGYGKHSKAGKKSGNRRNGSYDKTIIDNEGKKIKIEVPRDRDTEYEPQFVPKGLRRFEGFDDQVISLYGRGMTMAEIQGHLEELYQTEVSKELISTITDGVIEEVRKWQNRSLDEIYPILYLDCIHVKGRDNHTIINKAVYLAIGVNMEGQKELLGIWVGKNEGSKFWMQIVTELKNRGVKGIYVACVDGLKGFPEAINSIYPNTTVQLCIVHMIRNSVKYVSYKDLKEVTADLKKIYTAVSEEVAELELEEFAEKWDKKYQIIKNKGVFPDDKSILKIMYLALKNAAKKWTMPIKNWALALNQFELLCGGLKYDLLEN